MSEIFRTLPPFHFQFCHGSDVHGGRCSIHLAMRILHFIPSLHPGVGGPARAVIDLCGALALRGHEVTVLTSDAGQAPQSWRTPGEKTPQLAIMPRARLPACTHVGAALQMFRSMVMQHDVVHVHGVWEFANVQISRTAEALRKPYVVSPRGMLDRWSVARKSWKKYIYLKTCGASWLAQAATIHLTADAELEQSSRWFPRRLGTVIPNLLDLGPFRSLPDPAAMDRKLSGMLGNKPRLLFLSRIHEKKGLDILIRACGLLKRQGRAVSLVVAGDGEPGYVAELKALAQAQALGSQDITFVGMITGSDKLALYQACDLFAMPTQQENFGFVFVEALSCGLPVVTTADIDLWREFAGSGAAVIVDRTAEAFAAAAVDLLGAPAQLQQMRAKGRTWALDAFDPLKTLAMFERMYEKTQTSRH